MIVVSAPERLPGSFRDPDGFVFRREGVVLRQVSQSYRREYDHLMGSGLYSQLVDSELLLSHSEVAPMSESGAYKVLRPVQLSFVSYPYEWAFSCLKQAALLTIKVQRAAMKHGMSLKDASAYNVQIHGGRLCFIDTLSFEFYDESQPWRAYRQFCQHFLAPLALMRYVDVNLGQLQRLHIDGIPLQLASKLLPKRSWLSPGIAIHIHLHARSQTHYESTPVRINAAKSRYERRDLERLLDDLEAVVSGLEWKAGNTNWADYYEANNNYSSESMAAKESALTGLFNDLESKTVWDFGANNGRFSRIALEAGARTVVSWDMDPSCVEANYQTSQHRKENGLIPLLLDLTNPSPAQGWAHAERMSVLDRGPADVVMALGLVHHLAIGNNLPLSDVANFLSRSGKRLIIEWIPKEDSQVQKLLASRKDIFDNYTPSGFENEFAKFFEVEAALPIKGSSRVLYRFRRLGL